VWFALVLSIFKIKNAAREAGYDILRNDSRVVVNRILSSSGPAFPLHSSDFVSLAVGLATMFGMAELQSVDGHGTAYLADTWLVFGYISITLQPRPSSGDNIRIR
jgi:hypothetical protein